MARPHGRAVFVPEALMHAITVDPVAAAALAATADVEVWDGADEVLGLFVPEARDPLPSDWNDLPPVNRVRVRGVAAEKLRAAGAEARVVDAAGGLLGHFLPYPAGARSAWAWKPVGVALEGPGGPADLD